MIFKKYSLILIGLLLTSSMVMELTAIDRIFPCTYHSCRKTFTQKSNLKAHYRTHTGERPYACDYPGCGKSFGQKSHLDGHLMSHTGEKPYSCAYSGCSKSFANKSNLKRHETTHSEERPYVCNRKNCGVTFSSYIAFYRHLERHPSKKAKIRLPKKMLGAKTPYTVEQPIVAEVNPALNKDDDLLDIENLSAHQDFDDLIGPVSEKDLTLPDSWSDDEIVAPPVITKKAKIETVLPLVIMRPPKIDE